MNLSGTIVNDPYSDPRYGPIEYSVTAVQQGDNTYQYEGSIGYSEDKASIKFMYNSATKQVIVPAPYRRIVGDNDPSDTIPYWRFPRTKDGISIETALHSMFGSTISICYAEA